MRGSELREWRKILGYTQEEAGEALDVTRVTIQNWEYEITKPPRSVQLACRLLLRRWKQLPNFGPVTLVYANSPLVPSTAAPTGISFNCEKCIDNQDAFRRLAVRKNGGIFSPLIVDETGAVIWSGEALLKVCNEY